MDLITEWWNSLSTWAQSGVVLAAGLLLHLFVRLFLLRGLERLTRSTENDLDDRLYHFIRRFYAIALFFVLVMLVLKINGIEITPLLASAGILGIAIGLAAKETLADILAGVFLIVDRPLRVGDRIKIDRIGNHWGSWGDVADIGLRRTQVRNTDGVIVNYPNNVLANSIIQNFSFEDQPVRVRVRFQVGFNNDLDKVCTVSAQAINATEGVMPDTADIVVRSLWDDERGHDLHGILVEGRYRIADIRSRTRIRSGVLKSITLAFREAKIEFANPILRIDR